MILIVFGVAAFLSVMLWMIILQIKPNSLKITEKIVCSKDEKIEILFSTASHHQPGERSIEIYCNAYGKRRNVKAKTLLLALFLAFLLMLPVSFLIVTVFVKLLPE